MAKKKNRGKSGQGKGDQHNAPANPETPPNAATTVNDPTEAEVTPGASADQNGDDAEKMIEAVNDYAKVNTIATCVIAAATVIQLVVSTFQWQAANGTLDQMKTDSRPWINLLAPTLDVLKAGERIESTFQIRNSGRTPARILSRRSRTILSPANVTLKNALDDLDKWKDDGSQRPIAPGDTLRTSYITEARWDEDEIADIKAGRKTLYFAVKVMYTDSTGEEYESREVFDYIPTTGEWALNYEGYGVMR